jgi:hypothetical protein
MSRARHAFPRPGVQDSAGYLHHGSQHLLPPNWNLATIGAAAQCAGEVPHTGGHTAQQVQAIQLAAPASAFLLLGIPSTLLSVYRLVYAELFMHTSSHCHCTNSGG